jgi:hypothetical protein
MGDRHAHPINEEDLFREWMKRHEKKIGILSDQISDIIQKKIYCGELSRDLNQKSSI